MRWVVDEEVHWEAYISVAKNRRTSAHVLHRLADVYYSLTVHLIVANNPITTQETLIKLVDCKNVTVIIAVLAREDITVETLTSIVMKMLSSEEYQHVLFATNILEDDRLPEWVTKIAELAL